MSGLYLHIPYCHSKCAYCDFFSTPKISQLHDYVDALVGESRQRIDELSANGIVGRDERVPSTIYVGGGTPSILSVEEFARLVEGLTEVIREKTGVADALRQVEEFTVEANPEDLTPERLEAYRALGVNRISIGVQVFDNEILTALGRNHDVATAHDALAMLKESGMNYSADLIFGLPGQTSEHWQRQLETLLAYRPPHFSAYLLSYEPGTRLYARMIAGKVRETDEAEAVAMYRQLTEAAAAAGYEHYEISNYCRPGRHSRHNSSYWNYTPYIGLGVSAHSFDGMTRRYNESRIDAYIAAIAEGKSYVKVDEETEDNRLNDYIITSLRTSAGLNLQFAQTRFPEFYPELMSNIRRNEGLLEPVLDDGGVRVGYRIPESGWLSADALLRELIV